MMAYTFSTWKQRLLLRIGPDFCFRVLPVSESDTHMYALWVAEDLQDIEFFCSDSVHNEIGKYLAVNYRKPTRTSVRFACQIFVFLLVLTDNRDSSIKHVYDWLDNTTAISVFAQAYVYVERAMTHGTLLPYIQAVGMLFENTSYDFECDAAIINRVIRLSELDNPVVVSNLTAITSVVADVPDKLSPSFLIALMLNIDSDSMYQCIHKSLIYATVLVADTRVQETIRNNLPEDFTLSFGTDGRLVGYTPSPEFLDGGESIFTTRDISYDM